MVRALALWLNASITAQKAAEMIASFFLEIIFTLIRTLMFYAPNSDICAKIKHYLINILTIYLLTSYVMM